LGKKYERQHWVKNDNINTFIPSKSVPTFSAFVVRRLVVCLVYNTILRLDSKLVRHFLLCFTYALHFVSTCCTYRIAMLTLVKITAYQCIRVPTSLVRKLIFMRSMYNVSSTTKFARGKQKGEQEK
jgi:hypothetical protein